MSRLTRVPDKRPDPSEKNRKLFFKNKLKEHELYENFSNVEHVHNFSWYIGNYPTLEIEKIDNLLGLLNG